MRGTEGRRKERISFSCMLFVNPLLELGREENTLTDRQTPPGVADTAVLNSFKCAVNTWLINKNMCL